MQFKSIVFPFISLALSSSPDSIVLLQHLQLNNAGMVQIISVAQEHESVFVATLGIQQLGYLKQSRVFKVKVHYDDDTILRRVRMQWNTLKVGPPDISGHSVLS